MTDTANIICSICCESRVAVDMCATCRGDDKSVCEICAVELHGGCDDFMCNCYGFKCPFCRKSDKNQKKWTDTSALFWKARAKDLARRVEDCATALVRRNVEVDTLLENIAELSIPNNVGVVGSSHSFVNSTND